MNNDTPDDELEQKHSDRYIQGVYTEAQFHTAVSRVLDRAGVAYDHEHVLDEWGEEHVDDPEIRRQCDFYLPETDTILELKQTPNLPGVGQCAYYSRFCNEVVLLFSGPQLYESHKPTVEAALRKVPDTSYVGCIPKITDGELFLVTSSDSRFVYEAAHGGLGEYDFAEVEYAGPVGTPWPREFAEKSPLPGGRIEYDQF